MELNQEVVMSGLAPIRAEARARDIHVELDNSCNCCCFGWLFTRRAPAPETPMYINSHGEAVRFDPRRAEDERVALQRAVSNLQKLIAENAAAASRDVAEVREQIEKAVGQALREEDPPALTYSLIERINAAIKDIFD